MRGAGCAYNDIVDRDIDARVARTAMRPIPAGQVTVGRAIAFLIALCLVGFLVLIQFNKATILVGLASLGFVAIYPFAKRFTWWPQAFLGLAFNWGALVGFTAVTGAIGASAFLLYLGGLAWTIGYDTIYAHQDREDDALIGVKSSARRLGSATRPALDHILRRGDRALERRGLHRRRWTNLLFRRRRDGGPLHLAGESARHRRRGALPQIVQGQSRRGPVIPRGLVIGSFPVKRPR